MPAFQFEPNGESFLHIIPRKGTKQQIFSIAIDTGFAFHVANAWEDRDGTVHLYVCRGKYIDLDAFGKKGYRMASWAPQLYHYQIDMLSRTIVQEGNFLTVPIFCEFPEINNNFVGRKNKYVYASQIEDNSLLMPSILKFDLETKEISKKLVLGKGLSTTSVTFVPKRNDFEFGKNDEEDDGFLLTYVNNSTTNKSQTWVIDAKDLKPVAKVELEERVPAGFHGSWISSTQMKTQAFTF